MDIFSHIHIAQYYLMGKTQPESHLNGQHLDHVVYGEYICIIRVVLILQPHHHPQVPNHDVFCPAVTIFIKPDPVLFQTFV